MWSNVYLRSKEVELVFASPPKRYSFILQLLEQVPVLSRDLGMGSLLTSP